MQNTFDYSVLDAIIENYEAKQSAVIAILQEVQEYYHYLPHEIFEYTANRLNLPIAEIYSVATFYENFSLEPKGKYVIKVCDGTACHVRKSIPILERLRSDLNLTEKKKTTDDMLFTLETVSCLGACSLAPVIMVNDKVYSKMTPDKATELLETLRGEN